MKRYEFKRIELTIDGISEQGSASEHVVDAYEISVPGLPFAFCEDPIMGQYEIYHTVAKVKLGTLASVTEIMRFLRTCKESRLAMYINVKNYSDFLRNLPAIQFYDDDDMWGKGK